MFPKIGGTPPNHSSLIGFSIINKPSILGYPYFLETPKWKKKTTKRIAPETIPLQMERSLPSSNFQGQATSVREGIVCLSFTFNITHDASMGRLYV